MSPFGWNARSGSYEYATASSCAGSMPASARHQAIDCSGSSQVENATGGLPCLRREKRSSSAAATVTPSTTSAAAGSWKTALIPRTFIPEALLREALLVKQAADQARDVHLRDPDALRDLGLREVLDETQVQHGAIARRQRGERRRDRGAVLDELVAAVLDADRLGVRLAVALVAEAVGLERDGVVRAGRLHRLEHLLGADPQRVRDLGRRWGAALAPGQLLHGVVDLHHALLHPARHVHGPAVVAEVALELAQHRRHRVRGERRLARRVEAVDRLDEAEGRHLHEVVERLVGAAVAPGHPAGEREKALDEPLARGLIAVAVIADEQAAILLCARHAIV